MPTNQPNAAATQDLPADARDDTTAASVLTDEQLDDAPGGGGLGGAAAAADPLAGAGAAPSGTTPNSPIDVPVPASTLDDTGQNPSAEAGVRTEAAANPAPEPHPLSASGSGAGQ
jgi:hypothetical protein